MIIKMNGQETRAKTKGSWWRSIGQLGGWIVTSPNSARGGPPVKSSFINVYKAMNYSVTSINFPKFEVTWEPHLV